MFDSKEEYLCLQVIMPFWLNIIKDSLYYKQIYRPLFEMWRHKMFLDFDKNCTRKVSNIYMYLYTFQTEV